MRTDITVSSTSEMDLDVRGRQLAVVSITSRLVIVVSAVWSALGIFLGIWQVTAVAVFMALISLTAMKLIKSGHFDSGRLLWYAAGILAVCAGCFLSDPAGQIEVMFASLMGGPFLTYSMDRERRTIFTLVGTVLVVWIGYRWLGQDFFGFVVIGPELAAKYIQPFSITTTIAVVGFEMFVFASMSDRYIRALRDARRHAEEASRAKTDFLAAMSHEIRTPMNGVVGMVDILSATSLQPEQRRMLNTIRESSFALLGIIEDILDMSRIEAGKLELARERFDLNGVIEGAVDTLHSYADSKNVILTLSTDPDLPLSVVGDAGRLRQIMLNLLGNAIKFSRRPPDEAPGHASIMVRRKDEREMEIVVTDDGIGIDPEFQKSLFDRFQQSEAVSRRRLGGSGLGLTIVNQLVTKMGGEIAVKSEPGHGAEFTVTVPLTGPVGLREVPNLEGWNVYLVRMSEQQRRIAATYLAATRGNVVEIGEGSALSILPPVDKTRAIAIVSDFDHEGMPYGSEAGILKSRLRGVPTLHLTRERRTKIGLVAPGTYLLPAAPALPSDTWAALRVLVAGSERNMQAARGEAKDNQPDKSSPARVLLVEDNEINQIVLRMQLEQRGHSVDVVENGRLGLAKWLSEPFDVVLTDCHMPEMDGFEMTAAIREEENRRGLRRTPIIAITANALRGEADRCIAAGMDGYIAKPVRSEELTKTLATALAEGRQKKTKTGL